MAFNAYYNGSYYNHNDLRIPLTDRSVFFGDGIYDAAIGMNGNVFMQDEHIDRFMSNAKKADIPINFRKEDLISVLTKLIAYADGKCFFLYFQLSRYSEERCHAYPDTDMSNLLATVKCISPPDPNATLTLTICEDRRHELCNIKTLNLLPAILASKAAERKGADEAILKRGRIITECSHSNVHILRGGRLITHPLTKHILPGISRAHLLSVCNRIGIPTEERQYTEFELFDADEVLVTSSSRLCARAKQIENRVYDLSKSSIGAYLCQTMYNDFIRHTAI